MNRWTEKELAALSDIGNEQGMAAYHAFGALTDYSKSFNAFEVKRRRVLTSGKHLSTKDAVQLARSTLVPIKQSGIPEDFVGFTIGFFDIETTFSTQPIVLYAAIADQFGKVEEFRKGPTITDDKQLIIDYSKRLEEFDILVGWNSALFDIPILRGRALFHGLNPLDPHMSIDLMYKASGGAAKIGRRSLQSVSEYMGVESRKTPLNVRTWDKAMSGDVDAYELIVEHCNLDCLVLREVFQVLKPGIRNVHRAS